MHMEPPLAFDASIGRNAFPLGLAKLTRLAFLGVDLDPIARQLLSLVERNPDHAGALMDLAVIDQLNGNVEIGLRRQAMALNKERAFHSTCCGARPRLRMLAFAVADSVGSNTPLEFLLEGSDIALTSVYVAPGAPLPAELPDHDVAFVAVGASNSNAHVLNELQMELKWRAEPVVNSPAQILMLLRDDLPAMLEGTPGLGAPQVKRVWRHDLVKAVSLNVWPYGEKWPFPIVIQPFDSRFSHKLTKIEDKKALSDYLAARSEHRFIISPFIDYQSRDGRFRKFRVIFVEGRPFACHMAVADDWNTQYFEAQMEMSVVKRLEEANFFANFDQDFHPRHGRALSAVAECVGLPYFGIDCAETPSGDLVIFKADHALLVHDMDPVEVFPYKPAQMRKIFDAFASLLYKTAGANVPEMKPARRAHQSRH